MTNFSHPRPPQGSYHCLSFIPIHFLPVSRFRSPLYLCPIRRLIIPFHFSFPIPDARAPTNKLLLDTVMATVGNTNKTEISIEHTLNFLRQFPENFACFREMNASAPLI
jgi:hypothetical protein